jgi:urease beta subunit
VDPLLKNPNLRGEAAVFDPTAPTTGNVISSSSTGAAGRAGEVRIQGVQGEGSAASSVSFERSLISTAVSGGSSTNAPATIDVAAQSLALSNGAVIRADTTGETPAGDITFHVGTLRSNVDGAGSALVGVDRVTISSTSNSSGSAGAVAVRGINGSNAAGSVSLSETDMSTASLNGGAGGSIIMNASGPIALTHSTLSANVNDGLDPIDPTTGRPGSTANITLTAPELTIQGGGITAQTNGTRNAGTITLNTDALTTGGGTKEVIVGGTPTSRVIISSSSTSPNSGAGNAGNVDIRGTLGSSVAGSINLQSTDVSTEAKSDGAGGPITIAAQGPITLLNSNLSANVVNKTGVSEEAANVTLTTGNQLTLNSGNLTAETTGTRDAGAVIVNASSINISNGGRVSSSSIGNATGSAGRVTLQGNKGPGSSAETISLNNGEITTEATGGSGGSIALNASGPVGLNNSTVSASVRGGTDSSRPKADIAVAAGSFSMNGGAITVETNGAAHAGDVTVNVGSGITLANGARISSSSTAVMPTFSSPGNAGSVTLTAGGQLHASGATVSSSAADGQGGIIEIQAGNLVMDQGTTISASTTGLKNAGNINLTSTDNIFITNSTVTTSAAQASGGDIKLTAPNTVRLVGANLLSDVQGNKGSNGGNISIDPQFVIIQGGSVISASASTGAGGKINIEATQAILMEAGAEKNIKATGGNPSLDGQINIQAPIQQLAGAIAPLPQAFAVASNLYGQRCAAQKGGQFSSFVQGARDGIPPQPGDLISSPLAWEAPGSTPNLGLQPVPSLAAIRLGLPEIDYHKLAFMTFSGCRS